GPCAAAWRRTCRWRPSMRAGTSSSQPLSHSSECQQRERDAVQVITDHKIERKSCAGEMLFVPISVGQLTGTEVVCRPACPGILSVSCGHIAQQCPGRL